MGTLIAAIAWVLLVAPPVTVTRTADSCARLPDARMPPPQSAKADFVPL
jgi:hypothetical protein